MKTQSSKEKYVTETVFKKEINGLHQKIDALEKRHDSADQKIDRVALELLKTNDRLARVENTMATKSDIKLILDRIDHLSKKVTIFDQEEGVQSFHLVEMRHKVEDHEKRISTLEASR